MAFAIGLIMLSATQAVPVYEEPSHRPVFANGEVRVLNVVLAPHVRTLLHTHSNDLVGVTIAPGPLRTQRPGEAEADDPADKPGDVWFESFPTPITHWGMNLGDEPVHYLVVEILRPAPTAPPHALPEAAGLVVLENARVRVARIALGPGQSSGRHAHGTGFVLGSLSAGELVSEQGNSSSTKAVSPGFLLWLEPIQEHALRNTGEHSLELFEFEILR